MVSYTPETLPPLTEAQIANLKRLAALPDSEIDTSDIPELTAEQWRHAVRGRFYRQVKRCWRRTRRQRSNPVNAWSRSA